MERRSSNQTDPCPRPNRRSSREEDAAWDRLNGHAGAIDSGDPHGSDNDRIEADLAREYGADDRSTAG